MKKMKEEKPGSDPYQGLGVRLVSEEYESEDGARTYRAHLMAGHFLLAEFVPTPESMVQIARECADLFQALVPGDLGDAESFLENLKEASVEDAPTISSETLTTAEEPKSSE